MKNKKYELKKIRNRVLAGMLCGTLLFGQVGSVVSAAELPVAENKEIVTEQKEQQETQQEVVQPEVVPEDQSISKEETLLEEEITPEEEILPEEQPTLQDEIEQEEALAVEEKSVLEEEQNLLAVDENFPNVVYVGVKHGEQIESAPIGKSPEYPYTTLEDAYTNVSDGGVIKVVDSITLGSWADNSDKRVTIEGWTGKIGETNYTNPIINMTGDWILKGDTTIQKLTVKQQTTGAKTVYPEGHRLQIGSGEYENSQTRNENRVVSRKADTFFRDTHNGQSSWFRVCTGPADGVNGEHIEKVDLRIYGGGNNIQNWIGIVGNASQTSDTNITNTPNLETINIEMIGSTSGKLILPGVGWSNGMAPAFDGTKLQTAKITLGYISISTTHSLFRSSNDNKTIRQTGNFSLNYFLDNVNFGGNGEAVAFGEAYTNGDMTIDVWDSTFTGHDERAVFTPCVSAGTFGNININLHNSSLEGLGNHHYRNSIRNQALSYKELELVLDNSQITDYTAFQDNVRISMKGTSSFGNLDYYPNISAGEATKCTIKNEGKGTIGNIDRNKINVQNLQNAELVLAGTAYTFQTIENKGAIRLKQTQTWLGDYIGGEENLPGSFLLPTGVTLNIQGKVSGKTTATVKKMEGGSQLTTIFAEEGSKESITWDETLSGTKTVEDGYWAINLGGEEIPAKDNCIYVRYSGRDTNDGTSYTKAVRSFHRAYGLATQGETDKKIVVCDTYFFSDACSEGHDIKKECPVVVTTTDGTTDFAETYGAKLVAPTNKTVAGTEHERMNLYHSFKFQNISITGSGMSATSEYLSIFANGHTTVMGEGVELIPYTSVFGGSENQEITGTNLTVLDGTYFHIYGGGCNENAKVNGDISLTVKNASFRIPNYTLENTLSIVGGSKNAIVTGNIKVDVSTEGEQTITNVARILGGNYWSEVNGNIDLNVSGAISFDERANSPVYRAIIGGCFRDGTVTGNINLNVKNLTGTGTPYIIGGNAVRNAVNGNVTMEIDGVRAYRIIGGCGNTYTNSSYPAHGEVTGDIVMNIGQEDNVQAESIYGYSADMGEVSQSTNNFESAPKSMTMNLGEVNADTVSGGIMGITVSDATRKVLSLNIFRNSRVRELQEFSSIEIDAAGVLNYDGTTLKSDKLTNNGTIQYQGSSVSVQSNYLAGENARIQMNSYTTVTHEANVSGTTKVSSLTGKPLVIQAKTANVQGTETESCFAGDGIDLEYKQEQDMSVWKYNPYSTSNLAFVYVDGVNGDDTWSGGQSEKGEPVTDETTGEIASTPGPVKTLEQAYTMIKDGGSIIVCGKTVITRWPNVQKKAFITSDANLVISNGDQKDYRTVETGIFFQPGTGDKYIHLSEDVTFRNLNFMYEYDGLYGGIDADGHTLVIGDKSDTYSGITDVQSDVQFYKIQDGQRTTPDTFLLVGGGIAHKNLEQIHLEIYNTKVKAVIGLWGGKSENDSSVVNGNVDLVIQDCETSKGYHYCSYDTVIDETVAQNNYYKGGFGTVNGDANVSISVFNSTTSPANTDFTQLKGVIRTKNKGNGNLHYIYDIPYNQNMNYNFGMFHAEEKCMITYESNGTGSMYFPYFSPVDEYTCLDGSNNPQVEVSLVGNILINTSDISKGKQTGSPSVVLNLGDEKRGSKGITYQNKNIIQSNVESYDTKFQSYRINYYPGSDIKFNLGKSNRYTTVEDGFPIVALHSLESDLSNGNQTEHILPKNDFIDAAVLECNNAKVVSTIDLSSNRFDLRLVNGGSYEYTIDDFELNGSLSMENGTQLITNGTVLIEQNLQLKESVRFPVENFLSVKGKIVSKREASLLVNNAAVITVGGAEGKTKVDFNGTTDKGYFEIKAEKGENPESYREDCFIAGTDSSENVITLQYSSDTDKPYVAWSYGTAEALDEIFISEKGSDENTGKSPTEAVNTFKQALQKAIEELDSDKNIKIVISGRYQFTKDKDGGINPELMRELEGKRIIITQKVDSTGATYKSKVSIENGFEIPCNLTFENIRLSFAEKNPEWYAGGNVLSIGEDVTVFTDGGYPSIYGGCESKDIHGNTEVNVCSGTWFRIYGGGKEGNVEGNTQVTLGDAFSQSAPVITTDIEHDNFSTANTNAVFGGGKKGGVGDTAQVTVNYGEKYGYIFGGSESGSVKDTEIAVDHKDVKIQRIYGGSFSGSVAGTAKVSFKSGNAHRIYGGSIEEAASAGSTEVTIGQKGKMVSSASVTEYLRGSGDRGGVIGNAVLNIMDGAVIAETCKAAAGGYTGGVGKSILNINGGKVLTDIYAGGAGEFLLSGSGKQEEIDPTKGIVSASEVHVTGGTVSGSVYGGGNMGSVGTTTVKGDSEQFLTVADITNGIIKGDFYGGGSLAPTYGNIQVNLNMSGDSRVEGGIFGGGQGRAGESGKAAIAANVIGTTTVTVNGAHAGTGIYGGCNLNGKVTCAQVKVMEQADCRIYGGGFGAETYVENTKVQLNLKPPVTAESAGFVVPAVYGGGDQGRTGISQVMVQNWIGDIYGGGRGSAEEEGILTSTKNIFRGIGNVGVELFTGKKPFAIDGLKDANTKETHVIIAGNLVGNAYGGGELATVGSNADNADFTDSEETGEGSTVASVTNIVIEDSANIIGNIYGGGKGRTGRDFAKIYGNTSVQMNGGIIQHEGKENPAHGCIFGGGEIAPVEGNTNVTVSGGTAYNVFGGNDQYGQISGNTNVTIKAGSDGAKAPSVTNVYGGGRDAAYGEGTTQVSTNVIIQGGSVTNAYGGGYGKTAVCKNTSVNISGGQTGTAFAGGNASTVSEKAVLTVDVAQQINDANPIAVKTIFAGNNQADMKIQPTINLKSGKIGTFYGGGNEGNMTAANGLTYADDTFGSENISITTVYGGCNQANVDNGVTLQLIKGTYDTVYGGNNISGEVHRSHVVLNGPNLKVSAAYGGGNQADIENASVTALAGTIGTIYGGGNNATATESVSLAIGENTNRRISGAATITDVYSGNNQASMDIEPKIDFQKGTVTNFYGGGNEGTMEGKEGRKAALSYTLNSEQMKISNVYGGGNKADVKGTVTLRLAGAKVEKAYGGCNNSGQVEQTNVLVCGNGTNTVYGGGQGEDTLVQSANVRIQSGEVQGNVYGGSGFGKVESATVTVQEENPKTERIKISGSVYGGGYGESSVVKDSHVIIDMALNIATTDDANADLIVKEASAETASGEKPSGETKTTRTWNTGKENTVSTIVGSVYGGGDMGKVGDGNINFSANTADITELGSTDVQIKNGYIQSSVFGGGSGTPQEGQSYTPYMGTVFGSCQVNVEGGYVNVSIYGCGHQSRVYAAPDQKAAVVTIAEQSQPVVNLGDFAGSKEIVIGNSVFAGGNKGEGSNQNASVYTVIGDTEVNLKGIKDKAASTAIYFLSDSQGGVYGDGNLCLVNGTKTVNLTDFNYGTQKELLKTFYSLQRADVVNLENSRIVLNGAKDLVDESADDTVYAINRVGQLNMKKNSALKLTTIVNLLGGLSSDQNTDTVYIDKGNNGSNNYVTRGGITPENTLKANQMTEYRNAYLHYLDLVEGVPSSHYTSFNVISVANGSYLEIKKSDTEYGNVTGLFTLELLHANPGEGGGFVYAEIGNDQNPGSTGDFICTTKMEDKTDSNKYMEIKDNVGGYSNKTSDFTYYYWYISGGKYSYKTNLKGYIGTADTEFDTSVNLTELEEGNHYILNSITGDAPVEELNSPNKFAESRFKDEWKNEWADSDCYAIEVKMVPGGSNSNSTGLQEVSLGYLSYGKYGTDGTACWGIKKNPDTDVIVGTGNENEADVSKLVKNDVYGVQSGTTGLFLQFVLHKGSGVTVEFKDVNLKFTFDVFKKNNEGGYDVGQGTHLTVDTYTSITRLVPTQAAFISSGRLYAGVSSNIPVKITKNSAFTAQFITKFVPSAFNTNAQTIQETLTTKCDEIYLLDKETGVGFTATEENNTLKLMHATEGNVFDYDLSRTQAGSYQVTYNKTSEENVSKIHEFKSDEVTDFRHQGMVLPKGTVITLVSQIDSHSPTYWYYHLTGDNVTEIPLSEFRRMGDVGDGNTGETYSFEKASNGSISPLSSNRVTENLVFVFDFSNVPDHQDTNPSWLDIDGNLMLKHKTTIGANQNVDIMDYVSGTSVVEDGVSETKYERVHPAISEAFRVSNDKSGISKFGVSMKDTKTYYTKDMYRIHIEIEEDKDYINTQYEEREYAVLLQQTDKQNTVIPFPEGTIFKYQGKNIIAGGQNQSVIIPVKKAGNHEVEIQTNLEGFDVGMVRLKATLYSSSVASYYNGLETKQEENMTFEVAKRQEGALQIEKSDKQQSFTAGDEIELIIQSISNGEQSGTVGIYKYDRNSDSYKKIALPDVFQDAADSFGMDTIEKNWKATINSNASPGTYRLEFQYGDKTEYWDFIIS